jgi:hypothetical protein
MTSKFSLGPDRRVAIDIMKRLVNNNPDQKRFLDALLGILFKNEAALINMTDTPSAYSTGQYLKSTATGAEWADPPDPTVYMCRLECSSQACPHNTLTDVSFTSEDYDVTGWWSSGATVTVPADGKYLFTARTTYTFPTDANTIASYIEIYNVTQSKYIALSRIDYDAPSTTLEQQFGCNGLFDCDEDDVIKVKVYQTNTATASQNFTDIIFSATQQDGA